MLKANKNRLFEEVFAVYNRHLFKRRFRALHIAGLQLLKVKDEDRPLILYANHSSWWDGLVAFEIGRLAGLDSFVMMEEKQLKKLFPFRLLGAFSVDRNSPRAAVRSLLYAVEILKAKPHRTLWIFPQGEILPNELRPLKLFRGLASIAARASPCRAAAVAMRYEFLGGFKPDIFIRIGPPVPFNHDDKISTKRLTVDFSAELTFTLDRLKNDVINDRIDEYERVF